MSAVARRAKAEAIQSHAKFLDCFVAEPVIGPRLRADPLAPRNDDSLPDEPTPACGRGSPLPRRQVTSRSPKRDGFSAATRECPSL